MTKPVTQDKWQHIYAGDYNHQPVPFSSRSPRTVCVICMKEVVKVKSSN